MYFAFLSGSEMIFVLVAIIILFGSTRIPQLGEALGKGIRNFRDSVGGKDEKDPDQLTENNDKQAQPTTKQAQPTTKKPQ